MTCGYGHVMQIGSFQSARGELSSPSSPGDRAPVQVGQPSEGALIIIDNYESSDSHGYHVEGAAASLGDLGRAVRRNMRQIIDNRSSMPHVRATSSLQRALSYAPLQAEEAREELREFVRQAAGGNVNLATELLAQVTAEGYRNSALNLSQGIDALLLLQLAKTPLSERSTLSSVEQETYASNLRAALNLPAKGREMVVDQGLLEFFKTSLRDDPLVRQALEGWRSGVREFEAGNNSVVVAAGNSGLAMKGLARVGFRLDGDEDFNLLSVPEVTTVGATTQKDGQLSLAGSSSFGPEVDVLADGDYQGRFGTSYAAPRVANALRAVHISHPDFSSEQAEQWLGSQLGELVEVAGVPLAILDQNRAAGLLSSL
jgi:hypothetical protein